MHGDVIMCQQLYDAAMLSCGAFLQIGVWSRPEAFNQTEFALDHASKSYRFFADYFETPEIVPKAGQSISQ